MRIRFEKRELLAPDIWQYYFTPEAPLHYEPGQYVDVHLLAPVTDTRGPMRTFTLTSLPSDSTICFVARFSKPMSGYKQALQALRPGNMLRVDDTMGDVILPKSAYIPLVFVAGGLGVASFISILRHLQRTGQKRTIHLHYSRRTTADNPFAALLQQFPFTHFEEYISPKHVDVATVVNSITADSLVYISGSENFVESMRTDLAANGVSHEQIVFDFFDGYASL